MAMGSDDDDDDDDEDDDAPFHSGGLLVSTLSCRGDMRILLECSLLCPSSDERALRAAAWPLTRGARSTKSTRSSSSPHIVSVRDGSTMVCHAR